jgi:hypothetical protein
MNTRNKKFSPGGVMDEEDLYDDISGDGQATKASALEDELIDTDTEDDADDTQPANPTVNEEDLEGLTGIERFLTNYGVRGGIISYEDGTSARFSDLDADEQAEILNSLVINQTPSIEQKYDLDEEEIDFINDLREANVSPNEYINAMIARRAQVLEAQRQAELLNYEEIDDDALFIYHLQENNPDITDEEIEEELTKAKSLASYETTVGVIRKVLTEEQNRELAETNAAQERAFVEELEAQREFIVQTVEDINDIGGARITNEMKEYLLHDIMELNDNQDPIIMEKLFSDPSSLFKANWFINYGEAYMKELNEYWKNKVSEARKEGYIQATKGMPGVASNIPNRIVTQGNPAAQQGRVLSEEDLYAD